MKWTANAAKLHGTSLRLDSFYKIYPVEVYNIKTDIFVAVNYNKIYAFSINTTFSAIQNILIHLKRLAKFKIKCKYILFYVLK